MDVAEIRARLVLDENINKTLQMVQSGFGRLDKTIQSSNAQLIGFGKTALGLAGVFEFTKGISSIKDVISASIEAVGSARGQTKELASALMMTDKMGKSFQDISKEAGTLRKELREIGLETGVSGDTMVEAYATLAERSTFTAEQNKKMIRDMALAGKGTSGGLSGITQGFAMMEMGMIRARNPLVSMIANTGVLHGNAKEVAKQLQKMTSEKSIDLALKAITKFADKTRDLPIGIAAVKTAISEIRTDALEIMGKSITSAIGPMALQVRKFFVDNRGDLEKYASLVGVWVSARMKDAGHYIKEAFDYAKSHSDGIRDDIKSAWGVAKRVIDFAIEHKHELMLLGGMYVGSKVLPSAASAAGNVAGTAANIGGSAWTLLKLIGTADLPAFSLSLGKASDAIGKSGVRIGEVFERIICGKMADVSVESAKMGESLIAASKGLAAVGVVAGSMYAIYQLNEEISKGFGALVEDAHNNLMVIQHTALKGNSDELDNVLQTNLATGKITKAQVESFYKLAESSDYTFARVNRQMTDALSGADAGMIDPIIGIADAYQTAMKFSVDTGNTAIQKYAAQMILNSGNTLEIFKLYGANLGDAIKDFGEMFKDADEETLKKLARFLAVPPETNAGAKVINNNTFIIHQDFRNEDPDRIALVFRADIDNALTRRKTTRLGNLFGS